MAELRRSSFDNLLAASLGGLALFFHLVSTAYADSGQLSPGVTDTSRYGFRFQGVSTHREGADFTFSGQGVPLELSVSAFDIDSSNEVRVLVNDVPVGYLAVTANNAFAASALIVSENVQDPGVNTLRFVQKRPGYIWGITDILLTPTVVETPRLTLATSDTTRYGYRFQGVSTHEEGATFVFEGQGAPMDLSVRAFDIDSANEVRVLVNDVSVGYLSVTPNNAFATSTLPISADDQIAGDNVLRFVQKRPGYIWGVTDLTLTLTDDDEGPGPGAPPVADAGPDQSVALGASVILDGAGSSDPDDDITSWSWIDPSGTVVSTASLASVVIDRTGDSVYTLTVTDSTGNVSSDTTTIRTAPTRPALSGYELAFEDEFRGSELDASKWYTGLLWGPYYTINNEQQMYVDSLGMHSGFSHSPFEMTGETLKIVATPTSSDLQPPPRPPENSSVWQRKHSRYRYNGPTVDPTTGATYPGYQPENVDYLSGIITSYDSFKMTHGYVEARAKLPAGQGLWPAFWMLPTHYVENVPEIDVMEFLGHQVDRLYNTYHFFDVPAGWKLVSSPSFPVYANDWTQDFHTFGMEWSPRKITWFVDGVETHSITEQDTHSSGRKYTIPTQAMYLIANLAVGGNWPGDADETTPFPATFELDYIRAYKKRTADPINLSRDYQVMFSDEFDGSALDPTKWSSHFLWGPYLPINREDQYYVDALQSDSGLGYSPFSLADGVLSITAREADDPDGISPPPLPDLNDPIWTANKNFRRNENYLQQDFTSGLLTSYDSFRFSKGYAEIRARVPKGDGLWPAFWLLNAHYISQQPEIDILEVRGRRPDQIVHNYHRFETGGVLRSDEYVTTRGTPDLGYSDGFHVYGARWRPGRIDWYVDGVREHSYIGDDVGYQLMYVILNLAVGGGFDPGAETDPADFPATFDIDYVRVYQEKD